MSNSDDLWERDDVQFPRLLAEIKAAGLSGKQMDELRASMDLDSNSIHELLDRAEETFEAAKEQLDFVQETCISCNRKLKSKQDEALQLARSVIRDLAHGWLDHDLAIKPHKLCEMITELLGDKFNYETGDES